MNVKSFGLLHSSTKRVYSECFSKLLHASSFTFLDICQQFVSWNWPVDSISFQSDPCDLIMPLTWTIEATNIRLDDSNRDIKPLLFSMSCKLHFSFKCLHHSSDLAGKK